MAANSNSTGTCRSRGGKREGCTTRVYGSWDFSYLERVFTIKGIEQLWRDLWAAVTCIYFDVLHYLEEEGYLKCGTPLLLPLCLPATPAG
ncbi:hypothetical protein ATANTOWER_010983 [Ataeniobius toweri]|uniref:Uncharacterized protein n=1 Tax=Ataeniobius toweri TaxID=208326 RepID=A0ABU7BKJ5_9TELE|nr:hypothetical protein [Ataeniobius toweri]